MTELVDRLDRIERRLRDLQGGVDAARAELDELRRIALAQAAKAGREPVPVAPATASPRFGRREPFPSRAPRDAAAPPEPQVAGPPAPPRGPSLGDRVADVVSGLSAAATFALVGGIVTLLGVVFIFVLAANRGWIGPPARLAIGAAASAAVLLAGIALRARYGRLQASLAAAGAGIAGGYATLAAATLTYDYLPGWGALLAAAAIAGFGAALAVRWSSQLLAGLALVGAAATPGAFAIDDAIGAAGTAFAVIVFAAALGVAAPRRWVWLAAAVGGISNAQVVWLAAAAPDNDAGAVAVTAAASAILLAGALLSRATAHGRRPDPVAQTLVLVGGGLALWMPTILLPGDRAAGIALALAAAVYGAAGCVAASRWRDLGWTAAAVGLLLAGVATAYLLSERSLTVAWAIEAAALAVPARRLASPRFELSALAYVVLGAVHVLAVDIWAGRPPGDLPRPAAVGTIAVAAAAVVVASLAVRPFVGPSAPDPLAPLWRLLVRFRGAVRLALWAVAAGFVAAATAAVFSGAWLTLAWAAEAVLLAVPARRLPSTRFELAALAYLSLGALHVAKVDVSAGGPPDDLPGFAAVGMFPLAAAALVVGVLATDRSDDAGDDPLTATWRQIAASRGTIRFWLWTAAVALGAAGSAALASERTLTITWAAAAAALALAAHGLGDRRLQGAGLAFVAAAALHALAVEAPPETLVLGRGDDALAPVPSLAAVAGAAALSATLGRFADRGIASLGPLAGMESRLAELGRRTQAVRGILVGVGTWYAVWAAALLLVELAYEPGQAAATCLWAAAGIAGAALAARRRSGAAAAAAAAAALFGYGKAVSVDWDELGDVAAAIALLGASAGVLLLGFFARRAAAASRRRLAGVPLATGLLASLSALAAVDRLAPDRTRLLGVAALGIGAIVGALAVRPHREWRERPGERWLRNLATVHWSVALLVVVFGEACVVEGGLGATAALWALSGALVATCARPLAEDRLWLAGSAWTLAAAAVCLFGVTEPSRLVVSSAHPGAGLWALAAGVASLGWIAQRAPAAFHQTKLWIAVLAVALTVLGLSLGVLEIAERVSGASVDTDFQRGHTAVSALWGALALGVFVAGLVRSDTTIRRVGLALFGLSLAKLFLYDLRTLSSITRALSFLAVGALLLAAAFFVERILRGGGGSGHAGPRIA